MIQDLHDFPFDQYQRYATVRDLVSEIKRTVGRQRLRLLDVGGFFRLASGKVRLPLPSVLPGDDVVVADVAQCKEANYVRASGAALPFPPDIFDVVVSCDTLEHVPPASRNAFVSELARVSRHHLIIGVPIDSPAARLAEEIVNEFVHLLTGAPQPQLAEHVAHGLPKVGEIEDALTAAGLAFTSFPCQDVYGWLFMMLAKHYLWSLPRSDRLHRLVDHFYTVNFSQGPLPESSATRGYRRFFVATKVSGDPLLWDLTRTVAERASGVAVGTLASASNDNTALLLSHLLLTFLWHERRTVEETIDVAVDEGLEILGELVQGRSVGQIFVSHKANLCRVDLMLATYGRQNTGTVTFRLCEDSPAGREVARVQVDAGSILDCKWNTFRFPPQEGSRNRTYYLELSHDEARPGNAISVFWNPSVSLGGMCRYDRGLPVDGQLAFRTYYVLPTAAERRRVEAAEHRRQLAFLRGEYEWELQSLRLEMDELISCLQHGLGICP